MKMTLTTYPSQIFSHRAADMTVHFVGLVLILAAGYALIFKAAELLEPKLVVAVVIYVICALASNLASWAYHFAPLQDHRVLLRRMDHAAIYPSISGTFTPFFVLADTPWTLTLLGVCWLLTFVAIWKKFTDGTVKSKWSTASYLGLGAIGLCALPDLTGVSVVTLWCILAGAACYVIGTMFYVRKTLPYRYSIWHSWVSFGAMFMFAGIWIAVF